MSQFNLGVAYINGKGVRQDNKVAKEWFRKACDGGHPIGCNGYRKLKEAGF